MGQQKTVDMEVEVEKLQKELLGSCYDLFTGSGARGADGG